MSASRTAAGTGPRLWLLAALAVLACGVARADVVILKNGDRLTGTVERIRGGKVELHTAWAGTVAIDAQAVESVATDAPVTVVMKDYTRLVGPLQPVPGRIAVQAQADAAPVVVDLQRVQVMLPGRLAERDWRFTGRINLGLSDTAGNTEVQRFSGDAELVARRGRDRLGLSARGSQASERGGETEQNAVLALKYDRFIDERWYGYGGGTLEHDRFKDLRLRSTVGAGAGHQVIESPGLNLALEGGLDRVHTDYIGGLDDRFHALRLASRFDWWFWPDVVQLFNNNQGFVSLADARASFLRTQSGLRFPLRAGLTATVGLNVDWDGDPAPGRRAVDRQLLMSLGYRW
jgi:putative salt-induced outer membrane protein YdiY